MHTAAWQWRQSGKQFAARCHPFHGYVKLWKHWVSVRTNYLLCVRVLRRTDCVTRSVPGNGGGGWAFPFRLLVSKYNFHVFCRVYFQVVNISLVLCVFDLCQSAAAVYSRYNNESSANLSISVPGLMAFRSAALTTYKAGPLVWRCCDFVQWWGLSFVFGAVWVTIEKVYHPVVYIFWYFKLSASPIV